MNFRDVVRKKHGWSLIRLLMLLLVIWWLHYSAASRKIPRPEEFPATTLKWYVIDPGQRKHSEPGVVVPDTPCADMIEYENIIGPVVLNRVATGSDQDLEWTGLVQFDPETLTGLCIVVDETNTCTIMFGRTRIGSSPF